MLSTSLPLVFACWAALSRVDRVDMIGRLAHSSGIRLDTPRLRVEKIKGWMATKKKKQPNSPCPFQNHLLSMTTHPATLVLRVLVCQKQGEFGTVDNLIAFKPLLYKRISYFRIIYFYRHLHPPATHFDTLPHSSGPGGGTTGLSFRSPRQSVS